MRWILAFTLGLVSLGCGDDASRPEGDSGVADDGGGADTGVAPGEDGGAATDAGGIPDAGPPPDFCVEATEEVLQDVTTTPEAPYFVHHPSAPTTPLHTVIFLPGGSATRRIATIIWDNWLAEGSRVDEMRVIVPYADDGGPPPEGDRVIAIVDEILACYGGDPDEVHLAGSSVGGVAAFDLMLERADRFATLLGAPGFFQTGDGPSWAEALGDSAVFNGVGENDIAPWDTRVPSTHEALEAAGVDSRLVIFEGQGHIVDRSFDESVFYEFWASY